MSDGFKDWSDVAQWLYDLMLKVECCSPAWTSGYAQLKRWTRDEFSRIELDLGDSVDSVLLKFGENVPISLMAYEERVLYWLRLSSAYELCSALGCAPIGAVKHPHELDREEIFEWVVVRNWQNAGFSAIRGMTFSAPRYELGNGIHSLN